MNGKVDGLRVWVGTGLSDDLVELFFDRRPTDFCLGSLGIGLGHWGDLGQPLLRTEAKRAFDLLPRHGNREVIEYSIFGGKGRRLV